MRGSAGAAKLFVGTGASGPAAVVPGVDTGNGDAGDIVGGIAGGVAGTAAVATALGAGCAFVPLF